MTEELRKRLEEAAEKYADEYTVGDAAIIVDIIHKVAEDGFLAGAEYGYKEAIAQAKEWIRFRNRHACKEWLDKECADFENDMNKLWEGEK